MNISFNINNFLKIKYLSNIVKFCRARVSPQKTERYKIGEPSRAFNVDKKPAIWEIRLNAPSALRLDRTPVK